MKSKKLSIFLSVLLVCIIGFRIIGVKTLKFSLGLDAIYLQIVDIFSKYEEPPMRSIYNPKIDISMPLKKWPKKIEKKESGNFYNLFQGNLVLSEMDYAVFPGKEKSNVNPLSLLRIYNSNHVSSKTPLGYGWRPSWDVDFFLIDDLYVFRSWSGEAITFRYVPKENTYVALKNGWMKYKLKFYSEDNIFSIKNNSEIEFQFEQKGETSKFQLKRIIFSNGIIYNVKWNKNRIESISEDGTERTTRFEYDLGKGVIETVIFPSGHKLFFDYDDNLNLTSVTNDQGNYQKLYEYKLPSAIHLLSGKGEKEISQKFVYERKKLSKIDNLELGLIEINRDFLLGQVKITGINKEIFKFENYSNWVIQAKGPLDFNQKIFFDDRGRVIKIIDSQNLTTQYVWDQFDNLVQTENSKKGVQNYDYDKDCNLLSSTDPLGNTTSYKYEDELLIRKILPNGDVYKYSYNGRMLDSIFCEIDKSMEGFKFNKSGNLINYEDQMGNEINIKYDDDGYVKEKKNSSLWVEKYKWTGGKLVEVTYEDLDKNLKLNQSLKYDMAGRVTSIQNSNGEKILYDYDIAGRIKSVILPSGNEEQYLWTGNGLLSKFIKPSGKVFDITYDLLSRPATISSNEQIQYQFEYNKNNGIEIFPYGKTFSKLIDSENRVTELIYDEDYNVKKIKYAAGQTNYFEYDLGGNIISSTNQNNERISYFYDKNGYVEYLYNKRDDTVMIFQHNGKGNLKNYTDELSETYQINYDLKSRPISISKGLEEKFIEWKWSNESKLVEIVNNSGYKKQYFYNTQNELSGESETGKGLVEYDYFPGGNLMYKIDKEGRRVGFAYYSNSLLKEKKLQNSDVTYKYNYDLANRIKKYSGIAPVNFTWSDSGSLIKLAYDKKNILLLAYSSSGKLIKKTYPGLLVQLNKYNEAGLLENISENGLDPIKYEYDSQGKINLISYPNKLKTKYEYDSYGRIKVISTTNQKGKIVFNRAYTYNRKNQVIKILTERGYIKRDYDSFGRIILEVLDDKDNTSYAYTYRAGIQIDTIKVKSKKTEIELKCFYDEQTKNIIKLVEVNKNGEKSAKEEKFRINLYGRFKQLAQAGFLEVDGQVVQISDNKFEVNNITLEKGINQIPVHYISASGREYHFNHDVYYDPSYRQTFKYDSMGNIIFEANEGLNKVFYYNDEGNIREVKTAVGSKIKTTKFKYYANGQLCLKEIVMGSQSSGQERYQYLFDEDNNIIGEFSYPEGSYKNLYMFSNDKKIAYRIDRGHKKYYYHLDKDGSVIGVTDNKGSAVCAYSYDSFGRIAFSKQKIYNPFLYLGHFYEKDSDFYFHENYTGRPYFHAIKYEKSGIHEFMDEPSHIFKEIFKKYPGKKPKIISPEEIINSVFPEKLDINLYENEHLLEPDTWVSK